MVIDNKSTRKVTALPADSLTNAQSLPEEPLPQLFGQRETPELKAFLLPTWAGMFAAKIAKGTQTPTAMSIMLTLSILATCVAKRYVVCLHKDFVEPLNLWTATIFPSSGGTAHLLSAITSPLTEWERQQEQKMGPEIQWNLGVRRTIKKRMRFLENRVAKNGNADNPDGVRATLNTINRQQKFLDNPLIPPKLWTSNVTPARLQMLLVENGERIAVISDEGGEIMNGLCNGEASNNNVFLQAHAGRSICVNRMGKDVTLDAPALSFGLAIQPDIFSRTNEKGKLLIRSTGALTRFLYVVPRSSVGRNEVKVYYPVSAKVSNEYRDGIFSLLSVPPQIVDGREVPRRLSLSPKALDAWSNFSQSIEKRMDDNNDLRNLQEWASKLPGAVLRIAGIFHLVTDVTKPENTVINEMPMDRAIRLGGLLVDHALAAFEILETEKDTSDAKAIYEWIIEKRLRQFKTGDLWARFKGRFTGNPERSREALKELEERKIITSSTEKTTGRPATLFHVNSYIWSKTDS